jgi:hypothetical protein
MKVETGTTLTFDKFWRWLREHNNCILRAGTEDVWLFDHEELHWHVDEDGRHNPVVQLIQGKRIVSEMLMDVRDVMFVQATPQGADPEDQTTLFELIVAGGDETFSAYHFLMAHPLEEEQRHAPSLKH